MVYKLFSQIWYLFCFPTIDFSNTVFSKTLFLSTGESAESCLHTEESKNTVTI